MRKSDKNAWNINLYHYLCTYLSTKLIKYVNKQVIKGTSFGFGGQ